MGSSVTPVVARIVYASQANIQGSVYAEMERIRAAALRHNEPLGVFTALLYQAGWFLQWKEGPGDAVLRIMDRVQADPRHHSLRVVHSSRGPRLLSGPWSMAIVQCNDEPQEMAARVAHLRTALDQDAQYSPPAVWRRLSTPLRHPGADLQTDADAFQRILVCAAAGATSFGLVAWLAARHEQEVVHRRFAGAQNLDVGTDYVDFEDGQRMVRVIAMARKGLLLPLTRAFLPDYSHIVMLLSGDAERDAALMQRVCEACEGLAVPPILLGVHADEGPHVQMFAWAHRVGQIYLGVQADALRAEAAWPAIANQLADWRHAANSGWPVSLLRQI